MLQGALNGGRTRAEHPAVPLTPAELARDATAAAALGVRSVHVHPRDGDGRESLAAADCGAAVQAIRAAVPALEISLSTRLPITGGDAERRLALVAGWTAVPDCASVNVSEPGWQDVVAALAALGARTEIGLATVADAEAFAAAADPALTARCARILLEPGEAGGAAAVTSARAMDEVLDAAGSGLARLDHGAEAATWAVIDAALERGRAVRVGLEDVLALRDGRPAAGNAELLAAVS
jgi:uncharacterized protein (DUF849 family)